MALCSKPKLRSIPPSYYSPKTTPVIVFDYLYLLVNFVFGFKMLVCILATLKINLSLIINQSKYFESLYIL